MKLEEPTGSGTSAKFVNFRDWQPNNEIDSPRKSMKRKRESIYPRNGAECNSRKIERQPLPIDTVRSKIKDIVKRTSTAIFIGETGSGKSTQIPQICLELNLKEESDQGDDNGLVTEKVRPKSGIIGVTQPRKIAARSLADRVSKEIGCELGELVGYKFRFEDRVGPMTKLAYLTDGILLREALHDQLLSRYSIVIVDEVHERSVNTDVLLYILRLAQQARQESGRSPLKVFLMSATMQSERFSDYFNQAQVFYIKGRSHQVELHCANEVSINDDDYLYNAITTVLKLHQTEPLESGILVFLTGQDEIDVAGRRINQEMSTGKYEFRIKTFLLYSGASSMHQAAVFLPVPPKHRKVIFATNIAETSITIPGIRIVIDSGKVKEKSFSPHNRVDCLKVVNISKAQAIQRAGRAGRDAPGRCYRLYSKKDYDMMEEIQKPEILRTNLSCVLLDLVEMGLRKLPRLALINMPEQQNWDAALEELQTLGAIRMKDNGKLLITEDGKNLVHFPVEPSHAKILVAASKLNCLEEALTVVAFLSSETVFVTSNNDFQLNDSNATSSSSLMQNDNSTHFDAAEGDLVRMIKLYRAFKTQMRNNKNNLNGWCATNGLHCRRLANIHRVRTQLHELCKDRGLKLGSCSADFTPLRKAVCAGLFMNACIFDMSTNSFRLERKTNTIQVKIHPSSCLARRKLSAFVFTDLVMTSDVFARDVTLIDPEWLNEFKKSPKKDKRCARKPDSAN
ncbi:helicase associated domain (HA2) domain-containing protein [Ditylenchus destructor]|uniref:RNA helicase n=1 Tax=Ditylenchus destructor TaxID=166010 RepID=A0AAD4N0I6_9BILA|nr:helicase associated domain (HA2) domain-containing protein [Ditylenchus destructor]